MSIIKKKIKWSSNYEFQSFLDPLFSGTFRDNVRLFLRKYCDLEDYMVEGNWVWRTFLVQSGGGFVLPLYTIEERVNNSEDQLSCDHCHRSGWSHPLVSKRQYHFVIPIDDEWDSPLKDGVLGRQTHILHGLIHCNGFGHLLCINGREGGSHFVRGREVMGLWDRICKALRCREISLVDTSTKRGMDLRLLYGVSNNQTWFEGWGYKFCQGSSPITKVMYDEALEKLRSLGLDHVKEEMLHQYRGLFNTEFQSISELLGLILRKINYLTRDSMDIDLAEWAANLMEVGESQETVERCRHIANMREIIYKDLGYLYHDVLLKFNSETVWMVLESRNFTKEWPFNANGFIFRMIPIVPTDREIRVREQLVIRPHATIGDVKRGVEITLRDTYFGMDNLKVVEILKLEGLADYEYISEIPEKLGLGSEISVCVSGADFLTTSDPNYEGGSDESTVRCKCGCDNADGWFMVRCDVCKVWQHKFCNGWYDDPKKVLPFFLCNLCCIEKVFRIADDFSDADE